MVYLLDRRKKFQSRCSIKGRSDKVEKKLLTFAILAVILCSSTAGASPGIGVNIEPEIQHTSPGKMVEYTITIYNYDSIDKSVALEVDSVGKCKIAWFEWTEMRVLVPAYSANSVSLKITPDSDASGGTYDWDVVTTDKSASATATLVVQGYDYAGVTHVEGKGVFYIDKKVRSSTAWDAELRFAVNVDKHFVCKGEIEGFVSDEYLIEGALGDNPNFEQMSAVADYRTTAPGDYLYGDEKLMSSFVFGGTGAKIHEHYDVQEMDARLENINLHSTGDQRYKTELATINDFGGHFLIEAKQSVPGFNQINIRDEFFGNFTVCKHLIFRLRPDEPVFDCP
jgi:hypothetical protein